MERLLDIVARGVVKGCLEAGKDPAETIAIFRIPGAWEEEGFKILEKYGVEYCCRTSWYPASPSSADATFLGPLSSAKSSTA